MLTEVELEDFQNKLLDRRVQIDKNLRGTALELDGMRDLELNDEIKLGQSTFVINKILRYEPDRGGDLFSVAPRVLMNDVDLVATDLIGVGSRVTYRALFSGEPEKVPTFSKTDRIESHVSGNHFSVNFPYLKPVVYSF